MVTQIQLTYRNNALHRFLVTQGTHQGITRIGGQHHHTAITNDVGRLAHQTFLRIVWVEGKKLGHVLFSSSHCWCGRLYLPNCIHTISSNIRPANKAKPFNHDFSRGVYACSACAASATCSGVISRSCAPMRRHPHTDMATVTNKASAENTLNIEPVSKLLRVNEPNNMLAIYSKNSCFRFMMRPVKSV